MNVRPSTKDELEHHLYRLVMGQVKDYLGKHPEHVEKRYQKTLPMSLSKRIVNDLMSPGTRRELKRKGF